MARKYLAVPEPELKDAFTRFDTDNDGKLTLNELSAVLNFLGCCPPPSPDDMQSLLNDGLIGFEEFMKIFEDGDVKEDLRKAFDVFDVNKDGKITAEELCTMLRRLRGEEVTVEDCMKMVSAVDANGDGVVSFEEFEKMMMGGFS